jgi:hypothetical protein
MVHNRIFSMSLKMLIEGHWVINRKAILSLNNELSIKQNKQVPVAQPVILATLDAEIRKITV